MPKHRRWMIQTAIAAVIILGVFAVLRMIHDSGGSSAGGTCTTKACIASDAETLKGSVAKDNSVMTAVTCQPSTVQQVVSGTYTVHCAVSYSDGSKWDGLADVLTTQGRVDWDPTTRVSSGS